MNIYIFVSIFPDIYRYVLCFAKLRLQANPNARTIYQKVVRAVINRLSKFKFHFRYQHIVGDRSSEQLQFFSFCRRLYNSFTQVISLNTYILIYNLRDYHNITLFLFSFPIISTHTLVNNKSSSKQVKW